MWHFCHINWSFSFCLKWCLFILRNLLLFMKMRPLTKNLKATEIYAKSDFKNAFSCIMSSSHIKGDIFLSLTYLLSFLAFYLSVWFRSLWTVYRCFIIVEFVRVDIRVWPYTYPGRLINNSFPHSGRRIHHFYLRVHSAEIIGQTGKTLFLWCFKPLVFIWKRDSHRQYCKIINVGSKKAYLCVKTNLAVCTSY